MARGVTRWLAVTLAACGVLAATYLPPRGGVREPKLRLFEGPERTPARLRAQELAQEWRAADAALRLADYRRGLTPLLARVPAGHAGSTLLVAGLDSIPASAHATLAAALDSAWRSLGLGETKVAVGVVVLLSAERGGRGGSPSNPGGTSGGYLLPDSTDRATCVVLIPAGVYWTRTLLGQRTAGPAGPRAQLVPWLKAGLGPCAFVAAFGAPGKPVRRWLAKRGYDLALQPAWDATGRQELWGLRQPASGDWWWDWIYHQRFSAVACLGGRPSGCRAAVLYGADARFDDSVPRMVTPDRWWWRRQRLVGGERYLADVAREVGRDRFVRFWNSPLPVDTALAAALKAPVGEWTADWHRRSVPRLPLGAAAPPSAAALALLLAGAAVATVALTASRRRIR